MYNGIINYSVEKVKHTVHSTPIGAQFTYVLFPPRFRTGLQTCHRYAAVRTIKPIVMV